MRKLRFLVILMSAVVFAQQGVIKVNGTQISVKNFKEKYKNNIEAEGITNAIKDYVSYELMRQKALEDKADTTYYYKQLYQNNLENYTRLFWDSLLIAKGKELQIPVDSLNEQQRKNVINGLLIYQNLEQFKQDSAAIVQVNKALGEDYLNSAQKTNFKGDKAIFTTPTGKFTQQDYIKMLNEVKGGAVKKKKLSELMKDGYYLVRDKFLLDDMKQNLSKYYPAYQRITDDLRNTILINYFIEKHIYHKADQDQAGKKAYLAKNQERYTWPERYQLNVFRYINEADAKQVMQWLKQGKTAEFIEKQYADKWEGNQPRVFRNEGYFLIDSPELGELNAKEKVQKSTFRNAPAVIQILRLVPPTPMTAEEAGQVLRDDYRSFYFGKVMHDLRQNAQVEIPQELK
ncbi:peptidyl-prolyl cis-trans isomerase [Ornithobacterium rhinotracheale]|uniref:Peptidyl-prolyl cis-trans isomerase n=1 Tax=Ornithobacterium rhinotracheale TaxID=28251 RepID=A0A410JQR7_ORNRH|nr:peptidylprolyl isomerase [Ornithobacterium rhinotracheale]QAR30505.1 peptidyl-prolyl cis-trans isomerase [Ornithobacterium rhinotracheale]